MITAEFIAELKSKTDILDLVKEYTEMEHLSGEIYAGKCPHPDHEDSTPSFRVWKNTQSWACMACHYGKKGFDVVGSDCIAFIQWLKKYSWFDAVKFLADRINLSLPEDKNKKYYDYNLKLADQYYNALPLEAFNYLKGRGLNVQDIKQWKIGWDGERIVFPLFARYQNRILGFTKRAFKTDCVDKYKNSPNSKIFNKSVYFYGIHNLDSDFHEIRITEGSMDVILACKYGCKNILATLGTSFTDEHIDIVKSLNMTPVFCLDGDSAGIKAAKKAIMRLSQVGVYSKILILPENMDMADLSLQLKDQIEKYVSDNAETYGYHSLKHLLSQYDAKLLELKMQYYPLIDSILQSIPDEREKNILKGLIKTKLSIEF